MNSSILFLFLSVVAMSFMLLTTRRLRAKNRVVARAGKLGRFRERFKDPNWRRYGVLLLAGKVAGLAILAGCAYLFNPDLFGFRVFAADPTIKGERCREPSQHRVDADRGVSGVRDAGRLYDA